LTDAGLKSVTLLNKTYSAAGLYIVKCIVVSKVESSADNYLLGSWSFTFRETMKLKKGTNMTTCYNFLRGANSCLTAIRLKETNDGNNKF